VDRRGVGLTQRWRAGDAGASEATAPCKWMRSDSSGHIRAGRAPQTHERIDLIRAVTLQCRCLIEIRDQRTSAVSRPRMLRHLMCGKHITRPQPCKRTKPKAGSIASARAGAIEPLEGSKARKPKSTTSSTDIRQLHHDMTKSWRSGRPMKTIGDLDRRIKRHAGQRRENAHSARRVAQNCEGPI